MSSIRFDLRIAAMGGALVALTGALPAAAACLPTVATASSPRTAVPGTIQAQIICTTASGAQIQILSDTPSKAFSLSATSDDRAKLALAKGGDKAKLEVDDVTAPTKITKVDQVTRDVGWWPVTLAMAGTFVALLVVATLVTKGKPRNFVLGADRRYSNSQCQLALWFTAVATAYAAAVILRLSALDWQFIGGVGVTNNVIALTGLSALSFGGAKAITGQKVADAAATGQAVKIVAAKPNLLTDLVQNDNGQADIGDFQMILISLVAVTIFLLASARFLMTMPVAAVITLPDVDTTLLSAFGLGQGAYLFKKAASAPGAG